MVTKQLRRLAIPVLRGRLILALLAVLALSLGSAPVTRAATPRYIAPGGADSGDCSDEQNPCATIAYALVQAADGDTIDIAAGTYAENLAVSKDVILQGIGAGNVIVDGNTSGSVFVIGSGTDVTIMGMTITNGAAVKGGGIFNDFGGTVTLINSTISNNRAYGTVEGGGGIFNSGGTVTLTNSTISGNLAACLYVGLQSRGGGIFNDFGGTVTLINSTISNNEAQLNDGIFNSSGTVTLKNTIVADNGTRDCAGAPITSNGHNLDSDYSCNLTEPTDLRGRNPMLSPLQDNGGPTWTHALMSGSPAIDVGDNDACPATDQRGEPRPADGNDDGTATCDIGAYEFLLPGIIVVNNDEWTLSDEGFNQVPNDAAQFTRNVANWFTGDQPGSFLIYSASSPSLTGVQFASTMIDADHSLTGGTIADFSLPNLLQYDGIFLAGTPYHGYDPPPHQVLIDYVKAGGNIYLAGGTNPADPAGEAEQWNGFLRACGLDFAPVPYQNSLDGLLKFNSSHRIFDGVQGLYQRNGSFIRDLDLWNPNSAILVTSDESTGRVGLYAVCSIGAPIESAPTAIDLLSFTAQAASDHVTLAWETGTEVDNAGFNLHRATATDGPYTQLNDALIPAEGDPVSGASYAYIDNDVVKGITYYYKLEDVDIHGVSAFHGPVSATPSLIRSIYLPLILK